MEINTYRLQKDNEEFKDLTYEQLMKIAELLVKYYRDGKSSALDEAQEDRQDEIDDLENQVSELDEQVNDYIRLTEKYEDFIQELYEQQPEDIRTEIINFADINRLTYTWSDWLKNEKK